MIEIPGGEYYLTTEVAEMFDVHAHTVRRWCEYCEFEGVVDFGKNKKPRYLIPAQALDGYEPPSRTGWPAGKKRGD